jgi:peptidyl-tRNA hydrolase
MSCLDLIKQGAFKEWVESMSEEEQKNLAAPMNNSKMLIMSALRAKFESGVWEAKQRDLGLI